jgi:peroxiredoxin Q/BCP
MVGVGEKAADFELPAHTGEMVRLSSLRGRRVVLFFYPKDGSPGCTRENCMVNDMFSEFERLDAVVIGISRDGVESHRRFAARHGSEAAAAQRCGRLCLTRIRGSGISRC